MNVMFSLICRRHGQLFSVLYSDIQKNVYLKKQYRHRIFQNTSRPISHINKVVWHLHTMPCHNNYNVIFKLHPYFSPYLTRSVQTKYNSGKSDQNRNFENDNSPLSGFNKKINYQEDILTTEIMKNRQLSVKQWDTLRNTTLKLGEIVNDNNIDGTIMYNCVKLKSFNTGKSYFEYVNSTSKKINLALIGNYMKLCYFSRNLIKSEDVNMIEMLYKEYILKYPLLDANSAENVILGISITKYWTDYNKFLDMIWTSCSPGVKPYSAIIRAAFLNKEYEMGWQILNEMANYGKNPLDEVFELWLNIVNKEKNMTYLEQMLNYFANFDIQPSKEIALKVKQEFEHLNLSKTNGTFTSITRRGNCKNCGQKLEAVTVTGAEFNQLKTAFLDPVLVGRDIFIKTRPEELTEYQNFLKKTAPYDVVLDGLNIAYSAGLKNRTPSTFSFMVKSVVEHFVKQSMKVLVLGRKHMNQWPKNNMQFIENNANMFLTEDMSQDDPFLLYSTLYSGPATNFVSRDLMRGHKFLLKDLTLKSIFMRWQAQHQIFVSYVQQDGRVFVKPPLPYRQSAQQTQDGTWHIPYKNNENDGNPGQHKLKTNVDQNTWLCLRSGKSIW